jgi:hypothetical protein
MTSKNLLPFYFGSLDGQLRLDVEQKLLTDPEFLLDYLDLKRNLEAAETVPQAPSLQLWQRLSTRIPKRKYSYSLAFGLAIAASLVAIVFFFGQSRPQSFSKYDTQILFDSGSEPFSGVGVL